MKTKRLITGLVLLIPFLFLVSALKPVPQATDENIVEVTGTISNIFEGSSYDVNISLIEDDEYYYINRGLEQGLDITDLRFKLMYREVTLAYVKHWSPLDPQDRSHHVARLKYGNEVIFSEIQ